jgi:fructokinase
MFLSCGDALFDLFVDSDPNHNHMALSGAVGGSPLNVAIGLARLGHKSSYLTKISTDPFGQRMARHIASNDVDTSLCVTTNQNTTLAIVEKQTDGSAKYVFYTDNTADATLQTHDLPAVLPSDVKILHFASYSTVLAETGKTLQQLAAREAERCAISYDPNLRLMVEPDINLWQQAFEAFGQQAFIIKASDEDVDALMGPGQHDAFLERCIALGAQVAFITLGPDGARAMDASGSRASLPGVTITVEDTVGAGDTFQAAVLHWLVTHQHIEMSHQGKARLAGQLDLQGCLHFALTAASITCTRRGADLPSLQDVQSQLA